MIIIKVLPLVSATVIVAIQGSPQLTLFGSDICVTVSVKNSLPSTILSFIIGISNVILVSLAGNVTSYGPEL